MKVFLFLARHQKEEFYLRELAKKIGGSASGCSSVLDKLHDMQLVEKTNRGKNLYYRINEKNPGIRFFRIFVNLQEITNLIDKIKNECRKIVLFGSCARGEDSSQSDIDIFAVTSNAGQVKKNLHHRQINERAVNLITVTPREFALMKKEDPAFYREVTDGIVVWRFEEDE